MPLPNVARRMAFGAREKNLGFFVLSSCAGGQAWEMVIFCLAFRAERNRRPPGFALRALRFAAPQRGKWLFRFEAGKNVSYLPALPASKRKDGYFRFGQLLLFAGRTTFQLSQAWTLSNALQGKYPRKSRRTPASADSMLLDGGRIVLSNSSNSTHLG